MKLIEIGENGELPEEVGLNDFLREVIDATVAHYRRTGFVPPWIGYVGLEDEVPVGVCGYKSQPVDGRVEIAYGTAPGHEGMGVATTRLAMGRRLFFGSSTDGLLAPNPRIIPRQRRRSFKVP